jgi:hypothetical protein
MQHDLTESDATYYMEFVGADMYNQQTTFKRKFVSPDENSLHPLKLFEGVPTLLKTLHDHYMNHLTLDLETGCYIMKQPIIIFATTVAYVLTFSEFFKLIAPNVQCKNRIKVLYSGVQHEPWQASFCKNPNSPDLEMPDVLCLTHCVPAGLSIETHFTTAVYIFPNSGHITHRGEFQFGRRLRYRDNLWEVIYGYIATGQAGQRNTNKVSSLNTTYRY